MKVLLTVFLLALVIAPTFTLRHQTLSLASQRQIEKLRDQKGTWASFMVNLAEVHLKTGGPLDELLATIEEVVEDLERKLESAHAAFDRRTERHNEDVTRINDLIDSASRDIASTTETLQILNDLRNSLQNEIANIEQSIENNKALTQEAIQNREHEHSEFEAKVPEHTEAIAAINEALEVLSSLDDAGASFLQVKKLKKNVDVLNKKLKGQDKAFINALMQLASQNEFADKGAILKVRNLMLEVRSNLTGALALLTETEENAQAAHEQDLTNKANELTQLSLELSETQENLQITEERIVDNQEFLAQREADKVEREQDLVDENESYERDTEAYEDLVEQFGRELKGCQAALDHLNNAEIEDYIGGRMEQDVIIDQPHGMGVTVESNPHDYE